MVILEQHQSEDSDSLRSSEDGGRVLRGSNAFHYFKHKEDWSFFRRKKKDYGTCGKEEGITLTWRDLSVHMPERRSWFTREKGRYRPIKKVLNNVFGAVLPGTLLAMMGPSGAGKTTLMNALAHRTPSKMVVEGKILLNGHKVNGKISTFSGYLHQHDVFLGSLTVKEHLTFMARLKMDRYSTLAQRQNRVRELLEDLGLLMVQNTLIGNPGFEKSLSGGERKRLAFATEILTDPALLFCDEPASGIDSFNAKQMVKIMKDMANRGKTILCTIHQPSSEIFAMFDKVLLIAEGRIAYMGSAVGALEFFGSLGYKCPATYNPADYYIHNLALLPGREDRSKRRIDKICDSYFSSSDYKSIEMTIQHQENLHLLNLEYGSDYEEELFHCTTPVKPPWVIEWWWLVWRAFVDSYRNPTISYFRMIKKILSALLIGLSYTQVRLNQAGIQDIEGVLYFFVTQNAFPALYSVLNLFPQEMPLFFREYNNGIYRSDTYYISKMISQIPQLILEPFMFCLICYWIVGLQRHVYHFTMTVLIVVFNALTSSACGMMISSSLESLPNIMLFLLPFQLVIIIFGGLFSNLRSLSPSVSWVKYLSWFMYANEVLTVTQWKDIKNITCEMPPGVPCIQDGMQVIEKYSFSPSHVSYDFGMLTLLYFCFHFLGFIALHLRAKRK